MRYFIILLVVLYPNFVYGFMEDSLAIKGFRQFLTTSTYGGIYQYSSTPQNVFFVAQTDSLARYMIDTSRRAANKDVVIFVVAVREEFRGAFFETAVGLSKIRASKETGGIKQIQKANESINAAYLREIKRHSKYLNKKIVLISKIETIFDNKPYSSNFASVSGISGLVPTSRMLTELKKSNNGEESKWLNENVSNVLVLLNQCKGPKHTIRINDNLTKIVADYYGKDFPELKRLEKQDLIANCNQIAVSSILSIGQQLVIPITDKEIKEAVVVDKFVKPLPSANAEVIAVEKLGKDNNVVVNGLNLMDMTKAQAIDTLTRIRPVAWHLVSHGICGQVNRLASMNWTIADFELRSLNITTNPIPAPNLVFLSSCLSGIGGATSLAGTFSSIGAKNVIGALEVIDDIDAKDFAIAFYTNYLNNPLTTEKEVARTLRNTQISLMATNKPIWRQYMHFGSSFKKNSAIILGLNEAKIEIYVANNTYKARVTKNSSITTIDLSIINPNLDNATQEELMKEDMIYLIHARTENSFAQRAYNNTWGKIDAELVGIETIYFIPYGQYNHINQTNSTGGPSGIPVQKIFDIRGLKDLNSPSKPFLINKYLVIMLY